MPTENLFVEVDAMLSVNTLIYEIAFLNRFDGFEEGSVADPDFLKSLPRRTSEVTDWFRSNLDLLKEYEEKRATRRVFDADFDMEALERLLDRDVKAKGCEEGTVEVLDDKFAFEGMDSEIVFGITRNPDQKRLAVVFRGSINERDWKEVERVKAKEFGTVCPALLSSMVQDPNNPPEDVLERLDEFKTVHVHTGFFEYLCSEQRDDPQSTTKIEQVLCEVKKHLSDRKNKGYRVYFTGHSLGAALATYAATFAAISNICPKPVRLVTFASPHPGKLDFVEAFKKLEVCGRIEHLRIANNDDLTPQVLGLLGYRHTGKFLNLRKKTLFNRSTYSISSSETKGFWFWTNRMRLDLRRWITDEGRGYNHKLEQHWERLLALKENLEKMEMSDLFAHADVVRGHSSS